MSTEHVDGDHDVDPGPATLGHILDDLREADIAVSENPTYDTTHVDVDHISANLTMPNSSIRVDSDEHEDLGLEGFASGWVTPHYTDDANAVSISVGAEGNGDIYTATTAEISVDDARDLAVQLLASAAVVDDDQEDGLPGYTTE